MNCKPGDLAVVVRCDVPEVVGLFVRCVRLDYWGGEPFWYLDRRVIHNDPRYQHDAVFDCNLRPIRDQDGEDEMLRIAGLPKEVTNV
jgi:hypothetical protein